MRTPECIQVRLSCDICGSHDPDNYQILYPLDDVEVVRCRCCGLVFVNAPFDPAIYDGDDYWAEEAYAGNAATFLKEAGCILAQMEAIIPKGSLLDVGCGHGYFVKVAADRGWDAAGVEINRRLAAEASRHWELPVLGGDLREAAFADETFDAVTLFNVIEHLLHPSQVVAEAARVLRKGGMLVVETPSEDGLPKRVHRVIYRLGLGNYAHEFYQQGGHHHSFSICSLGRLLDRFGMRTVRTENLVSPAPEFISKQILRIRDSQRVREKLRPMLAVAFVLGAGPLMRLTRSGNRMRVYAIRDD